MKDKTQRFYYKGNQLKQLRAFCAVAKNMSAYLPKRSYGMVMRQGKYPSAQARAFLNVAEGSRMPDSPWRIGHSDH